MDQARQRRVLRQHVLTDRLLGVESVPLGEPRDLPAPSPEAIRQTSPVNRSAPPATSHEAPSVAPAADGSAGDLLASVAPAQFKAIDRSTKLKVLQELDTDQVKPCTRCVLHKGRTQTVFGEGDCDAKLMFIGEGPGQTEDETGRPFVGRAGELLDKMIVAMGLTRGEVFIANVVKCRPPNNRPPMPDEVDACWGYLRRQIETIQPRVIVTLGGPATKLIINNELGITKIRGIWAKFNGLAPDGPVIPVMPTFHPAYLLRSYTEDNRRKVWSDLKRVMEFLKS